MTDYYIHMYPVLCAKVHSNMNDIILKIEQLDGVGYVIDSRPQNNNHYYTQTIADLMIVLLESVHEYFNVEMVEVEKLYEEELLIWKDILQV